MNTFSEWASVTCIIMLSISILLDPNTGRIAALKTKIEEQQVTIDNLTEQQTKLNNKLNLFMETQHILVEK